MKATLPPEQQIELRHKKAPVTQEILGHHDVALIVCSDRTTARQLAKLPQGELLKRHYERARKHGSVQTLSVALPTPTPCIAVIGVLKSGGGMFEQLTLAGRMWKEAARVLPRKIMLSTCGLNADASNSALEALLAAVLAGAAPMPKFKSSKEPAAALPAVTIVADAMPDFSATLATHEGNHLARWLSALPPNQLDCSAYRTLLGVLAKREGWSFQFLGEPALRRLEAGAFLAVSRANRHRDAGIAKLTYRPPQKTSRRIALVGKGVCFDTGGINLKPHKSMYDMHTDMQGSAVAVGTLLALSRLKAPFAVDCWLALTENEIGPNAYRPQEIVRAVNGVTIQVVHSDAEGRMALADTLALACRAQPELLLDFATLTGACVMALTERMSGAFTNRDTWHDAIAQAGRRSGERVWNFPMDSDFDSDLESSTADVLQCTMDSKGDHILAARFLRRFVPDAVPWIHVDLSAGTRNGGLAHIPTEITGFGVRFAAELLLRSSIL